MKSILLSIKPKYVANILNGIKTLEIRKKFPSDYVGWVYIYCTKKEPYARRYVHNDKWGTLEYIKSDGKVVARFWCDKVEEIKYHFGYYDMGEWTESYILENSCLSAKELDDYLQASKEYDENKVSRVYGKAIHISQLEIFDKPKELKNFLINSHTVSGIGFKGEEKQFKILKPLKRAPQSWQHIEVDE